MRYLTFLRCCVVIAPWLASSTWADGFKATLELEGSRAKQTAVNEPALKRPPGKPRALLRAGVDERLTVRWTIHFSANKPQEEVLVHFFVAREDKVGQAQVPELTPERVVVESALTMDFKDQDSAHATLSFRVNKAGAYLVRVEAQGKDLATLDAPFAALDLEVK